MSRQLNQEESLLDMPPSKSTWQVKENLWKIIIYQKLNNFCVDLLNHVLLMQIMEKKAELQAIRENRLTGTLIRYQAQLFKLNEKASTFFLIWKIVFFVTRIIRLLKSNDGSNIQEPDEILKEICTLYNELYSKRDVFNNQESNFNNLIEKILGLHQIL